MLYICNAKYTLKLVLELRTSKTGSKNDQECGM